MQRNVTYLFLSSVLLLAACGQPAPAPEDTTAADEAAIRAESERLNTASNAADMADFSARLADDVLWLPPDGPVRTGREPLVQNFTDFNNAFDARETAVIEEVGASGDLGFTRGSWSITQTPKEGGATETRNGKWLVLYKRQADGSWKVWRWMFNQETAPGG